MMSMLFTLTIFCSSCLEREPLSSLSNTLKVHRSLSSSFPRRTRLIAATYSKKSIFRSYKHKDYNSNPNRSYAWREKQICSYNDSVSILRLKRFPLKQRTHIIHVERSKDVVHVLCLRSTIPHSKHPLELVQVQRSTRALQNE